MKNSDTTDLNINIGALRQSHVSTVQETAIHGDFSERFVDVLILRLNSGAFVGKYSIPLINEREPSHLKSWFNQAWSFAVADGLVADHERSDYRLELQGNLTVNEAIDRAQELNGMNVCVRGLMVLDFEHEALIHQPKSEYRNWLPPSNTTGHHRLFGSEIWLNLSTLGFTRSELSPCIGVWVSVFGTLHAVVPPDMKSCWHSRLGNWLKHGSAEPDVGLGHFGGYPASIDVLEITDLQPVTVNESEPVDVPSAASKKKVIRGSNVTKRIFRSQQSEKIDNGTAPKGVQHNYANLVIEKYTKVWYEKIENPGSWILWSVITLLFFKVISNIF
ncbi:hypothetical protein [Rhodoferax sp.]|uniref:hypothetical protein n=1 Tax=Rhodoferax sp. TaxID=50421 RepID=UPI002610018E|nr:hypothetical protein [Rhodoferax sp.]MDD3936166.1 hypothetical protein [Rhodoferax sp.]